MLFFQAAALTIAAESVLDVFDQITQAGGRISMADLNRNQEKRHHRPQSAVAHLTQPGSNREIVSHRAEPSLRQRGLIG
jgi:hypothetical protein